MEWLTGSCTLEVTTGRSTMSESSWRNDPRERLDISRYLCLSWAGLRCAFVVTWKWDAVFRPVFFLKWELLGSHLWGWSPRLRLRTIHPGCLECQSVEFKGMAGEPCRLAVPLNDLCVELAILYISTMDRLVVFETERIASLRDILAMASRWLTCSFRPWIFR